MLFITRKVPRGQHTVSKFEWRSASSEGFGGFKTWDRKIDYPEYVRVTNFYVHRVDKSCGAIKDQSILTLWNRGIF